MYCVCASVATSLRLLPDRHGQTCVLKAPELPGGSRRIVAARCLSLRIWAGLGE
jgi:hypothetical protein